MIAYFVTGIGNCRFFCNSTMTNLVDNGQDSDTPGKRNPDNIFREHSYTRSIARRVVSELSDCDYDTRILPEIEDVPFTERCRRVNAICDEVSKAHVILISIHVNVFDGRRKFITPFVGDQLLICDAFGFEVPEGCSPTYTSKKSNKGKRGRPPKPQTENS